MRLGVIREIRHRHRHRPDIDVDIDIDADVDVYIVIQEISIKGTVKFGPCSCTLTRDSEPLLDVRNKQTNKQTYAYIYIYIYTCCNIIT